ncbi:MAG TPA: hypothetical protein VLJ80_08015 [Solirubrobacteraceae bacterium]|nr:hypothetical protein [Solirubrobacteraceae bacterium]
MNIQLASAPEVLPDPEAKGLRITVPLTAQPDELLLDAIDASPAITAYCASVEPDASALVLVLKKDAGPDGLGTLMTAVSSLVELSNKDREAAAKTEDERRLEELEREQADAEAALQAWWESRS